MISRNILNSITVLATKSALNILEKFFLLSILYYFRFEYQEKRIYKCKKFILIIIYIS